jgi:lipid-A-disaccharide synthase-like uncharacterized protein
MTKNQSQISTRLTTLTNKKMPMKNETKMLTKNAASLQNTPNNWIFFAGLILSCIGEAILLSYLVFLSDNITVTGFTMALALLVIGNMFMLLENKIRMRS